MKRERGLFISLEGGEAGGKTTQLNLLEKYLTEEKHLEVVRTREPGGIEVCEKIRKVILEPFATGDRRSVSRKMEAAYPDIMKMSNSITSVFLYAALGNQKNYENITGNRRQMGVLTEVYLYSASRYTFFDQIVLPAINSGKVCLSDRSYDSTTAYQGYGYGKVVMSNGQNLLEAIKGINKLATHGTPTDLTFLIDADPEKAHKKLVTTEFGKKDRKEQQPMSYHQMVRKGFLQIAEQEPYRMKIINYIENSPGKDDGTQKMQQQMRKHIDLLILKKHGEALNNLAP